MIGCEFAGAGTWTKRNKAAGMDSSLSQLLETLTRLDVRLRVDEGRLICNAAENVLTPELRAEIGRRKPQLIALLGAQHAWSGSAAVPVRRPPDAPPAPVSFGQERLWLLQQMNPSGFGYNLPAAFRLHGPLNVEALEAALGEIVERHEILRTTISFRDGRLVQVVHPPVQVSLKPVPIPDATTDEHDRVLHEAVTRLAQQPIDLEKFPYWRITLLRIGAEQHVLVVVQHHIVSDGWSISILLDELTTLYRAKVSGKDAKLPALPIQYGDYAAWQRERLRDEHLDNLLNWWHEFLQNAPSALEVPTDYPRPEVQSERGDWEVLTLGESHCRKMRSFCGQHGVTPFMLMLSVFSVFLARYTGQFDLVIGTPTGNRDHPFCEGLLGFFINTLAIRLRLAGDPTFAQLVQHVRTHSLEVFSHQELPFEKLVEALQPRRDLSRGPITQVMFIMHSQPTSDVDLHELTIGEVEFESGTAKYDLTLATTMGEDHCILTMEYCKALYESSSVRRMLRHIKELLTSALDAPDSPISQLNAVPVEERELILSRWNQTDESFGEFDRVDAMISAQARKTPGRVAVCGNDGVLTYRELSRRTDRLSQLLIARGLKRHDRIAVFLDRSTDLLVAILAVWRIGAVYVPIDEAFPDARLQFITEDAALTAIVTEQSKHERVQSLGIEEIVVDNLFTEAVSHEDGESLKQAELAAKTPAEASVASPQDEAYIIYTSGSSGRPKGVAISHRAALNLLQSMARKLEVSGEDRILALTSVSFDISILELFLPLIFGAKVVVADAMTARDGRAIAALLDSEQITVMQATPTAWKLLLGSGWQGSQHLTALSAGEPLTLPLAKELFPRVGVLWNLYGPTETTVYSSVQRIASTQRTPSIGRPIANTQLYCLDSNLQPVPVGAIGELYIAGEGLANGYVRRPRTTADTFLPNPFSSVPGARMYRTGDLVRYLGNGELLFLGRRDRQIKMRGHRIELEEIEQALSSMPEVEQAVVDFVDSDDLQRGGEIVAWVVAADAELAKSDVVRERLAKSLPAYMVPNRVVFVESMPVLPSGKLNRGKLPRPADRPHLEQQYVPPGQGTEERIASIWKQLLRIDRVGLHDNFFDLGGHSLLLAAVRENLQREFGCQISMLDLFRHPNIWSLARFIDYAGDSHDRRK